MTFAPGSQLEKIGPGCFRRTRMKRIAIPKGVEEIPDRAFDGCETLREATFEEGSRLKTIGNDAFYKCYSLTAIRLPGGLKSVGESAFYECKNLWSVQFPEGLERLGGRCFRFTRLK